MGERWRKIPSFPGYEASDFGRIRSVDRLDNLRRYRRGQILQNARVPNRHSKGGKYLRVRLRRDGATEDVPVHWLVLEAFVGPRPPGMQGCHNDGDINNNTLVNLRWDTSKANNIDKIRHGTIANGERNGWSRLTEDQVRKIWRSPLSAPLLAQEMGVNKETIARIRRGENWCWLTKSLGPRPCYSVNSLCRVRPG